MKRKVEQGRSMIEMLGVLAIIGILSVAGIRAYELALAKHRANETAFLTVLASVEMKAAATLGNQANMTLDVPSASGISLVNVAGYKNAGIKVDFGEDVDACKQFASTYTIGNDFSEFVVLNKCEEN